MKPRLYASPIWTLYTDEGINKLEYVQRRFLRHISFESGRPMNIGFGMIIHPFHIDSTYLLLNPNMMFPQRTNPYELRRHRTLVERNTIHD